MLRRPPESTRTDTTLSLHDALPISMFGGELLRPLAAEKDMSPVKPHRIGQQDRVFHTGHSRYGPGAKVAPVHDRGVKLVGDRKRTRLNSSHTCASRMPTSARKKKHKTD